MQILCLMGKQGAGKTTIEGIFEKLGYTRIISYTTRKPRDKETNGLDYNFVTDEQFMTLVEKGIIMEWAEHSGNKYGSPRPFGSSRYVIVVELDGFKKIKEIFGEQAIGIYLDLPDDVSLDRAIEREENEPDEKRKLEIQERLESDKLKFQDVHKVVDLTLVNDCEPTQTAMKILKFITERRRNIHEGM